MFLASAGTVQAANDLDGKALFCKVKYTSVYPVYGLIFDQGKVTRWQVNGYSKTTSYRNKKYHVRGTRYITWDFPANVTLDRHTLKVDGDICVITNVSELQKKLDKIIAAAKKKNKL